MNLAIGDKSKYKFSFQHFLPHPAALFGSSLGTDTPADLVCYHYGDSAVFVA